ncbi:MAG: TPM domain-containing protein, partial [Bacteroidota bacterium]
IVIDRSLEGEDIFGYSYALARAWGIGREGRDNGILIYIAIDDRRIFIQTGYGAEGFLPDVMAGRIIDQVISPAFRNNQYYQGLDRATNVIMDLGSGTYVNDLPDRDFPPVLAVLTIIILLLVLMNIFRNRGGGDGGGYYRDGRYDWEPRARGRGGWMYFPGDGGGGWTNSGGGGGGFGGFGGGGFGGGGAGGSW